MNAVPLLLVLAALVCAALALALVHVTRHTGYAVRPSGRPHGPGRPGPPGSCARRAGTESGRIDRSTDRDAHLKGGRRTQHDALVLAAFIDRYATVLSTGIAPTQAWAALSDITESPSLAAIARTGAAGADIGPSLRGTGWGASGDALAAALAVSARTGAPLAPVLHQTAASLRQASDMDQVQEAAFAGPRATTRILLVLPLAGLGLGMVLGGDPLHLLFTTQIGWLCAGAGGLLTLAGMVWSGRMVAAAQERAARAGEQT